MNNNYLLNYNFKLNFANFTNSQKIYIIEELSEDNI